MNCEDCGCKVYNGHCVNCHEETYIAEQNFSNDEPIAFSEEFTQKLTEQKLQAKVILERQRIKDEIENKNEPNSGAGYGDGKNKSCSSN